MTRWVEDWRMERHDERIKRLEGDLREAQEKIRKLEMRPMEWLLKVEVAIFWIVMVALWVILIVEAAQKH